MSTLIIYYSQNGATEVVAKTLSKHINAELIRIKDLKIQNGIKSKILSPINAFREVKTEISPENININHYDTIYFGTPTWAGKPTPAILTIIDRCILYGKDIVLFTTMDNNRADTNIKRLEEKVKMRGGRVIETFTVTTKNKSQEQIINDTEAIINMKDLKMY